MFRPSSFILFFALCSTVLAADGGSSLQSCPVKGGDGDYNYDPTSGKGPEDWASLKPDYETCGSGISQSPINFISKVDYEPLSAGPKPMLKDAEFSFAATPSNWALSCPIKECGFTMLNGERYYHVNTHFHAPSEHTLGGMTYPLEVHFVHSTEDGKLAVLATMFQYPDKMSYPNVITMGAKKDFGVNKYFEEILEGVSEGKEKFFVRTNKVVAAKKGYCVYSGSLTTPPCSEGVTFMMALNIETVSRRQVHEYSVSAGASFDGNNRPVQPLNLRSITCFV